MDIPFAIQRDKYQLGSVKYLNYLKRIGDNENLKLLTPTRFISSHKGGSVKILDLACGPGNASKWVSKELIKNGIAIRKTVFVDVNVDRLSSVMKKSDAVDIIATDIFHFLKVNKEHFDIIVMRYALYYFDKNDQDLLINLMKSRIAPGGALILGTFGITAHEAEFLTELHRYMLNFGQIYYSGSYVAKAKLKEVVEGVFPKGCSLDENQGETTWSLDELVSKYGISHYNKEKLFDWLMLNLKKYKIPFSQDDKNIVFNVTSYVTIINISYE